MKQLLLALGLLTLTFGAGAQVVLDNYQTPTEVEFPAEPVGPYTKLLTTPGTGIYGGERDIEYTYIVTGVNSETGILIGADATSAWYDFATTSSVGNAKMTITYDGTDGIASGVNATTGLGGLDMTGPGTFSTSVIVNQIDATYPLYTTFRVYSSSTNYSDYTHTKTDPTPTGGAPTPISATISDFQTGAGAAGPADFTKVTAVHLRRS